MGHTSLTDEEIIGHLVQGPDLRLFEELVRRHQPGVLRQCRRQLKDTEAARDVSQEVWTQLSESAVKSRLFHVVNRKWNQSNRYEC